MQPAGFGIVWCIATAVVAGSLAQRVIFTDIKPQTQQVDVDLSQYDKSSRYHNSVNQCNCMLSSYCQSPTDGSGSIDIRIVTGPPSGVTCSSNMVYCCVNQGHHNTYTTTTTSSSWSRSCGVHQVISQSITPSNGQSNFGEYPWTALVLTNGNEYVGGGVLIDSRHVLTAAHRVTSHAHGNLKVRLGEWNAANNSEPYAYQEYSVSNLAIHPQFNANNLHNDIAVITLTSSVTFSSSPHINAACVMTASYDFSGHKCWVSGWGKDAFGPAGYYQEIMKAVDVVVMNQTYCQTQLRNTRLGSYFLLDTTSFLCAGGEYSKDACTGDGGSPLVCDVNGSYYVAGLVAWGIGCANHGVPGVYVNINAYQSWITQNMF